jgi:hypothetical protein
LLAFWASHTLPLALPAIYGEGHTKRQHMLNSAFFSIAIATQVSTNNPLWDRTQAATFDGSRDDGARHPIFPKSASLPPECWRISIRQRLAKLKFRIEPDLCSTRARCNCARTLKCKMQQRKRAISISYSSEEAKSFCGSRKPFSRHVLMMLSRPVPP